MAVNNSFYVGGTKVTPPKPAATTTSINTGTGNYGGLGGAGIYGGGGAATTSGMVSPVSNYGGLGGTNGTIGSAAVAPNQFAPIAKLPDPVPSPKADPEYDALVLAMGVYKIQGLAATLEKIRMENPNISSEGMLTLLRNDTRYNKEYLTRFSGNQMLNAAGKPMLDEKTYLQNEVAYDATFKAYSVDNYFSNTNQYAELIANSKSPTEVASIVSAGFSRVINADTATLDTYKRFYKALTTQDIVAGLIGGKETMPLIERKITSAEIGGAAVRQGLDAFQAATDTTKEKSRYSNVTTGTLGTETLMNSGETGAKADADYAKIAGELPRMEFLSSISRGYDQYGQKQAEGADILGLASEKRKKDELLALERARYAGGSGAATNAFTSAKQMY
jgi:hypothetical protein